MKRKLVSSIFVSFLLISSVAVRANETRTALPAEITSAHTIFVVNETGFAQLQNVAHMELSKWGRYDIVGAASDADLILKLSSANQVQVVPTSERPVFDPKASAPVSNIPAGYTRVSLLGAKSGKLLWFDDRKTEGPNVKGNLLDGLREAFDRYQRQKEKR